MKRIISIITAAAVMLMSAAAVAENVPATWVKVSSWAYNSVSNFKKEGLLPDSFNELSDYTTKITRGLFAELLYSALTKTKSISDHQVRRDFTDTESEAARQLAWYGIMEGEETGSYREDGMIALSYAFYPERLLTREEMAAVLQRTLEWFGGYLLADDTKIPTDYDEISEWAREDVTKLLGTGILSGMEDGSFAPKDDLTIEQAMHAIYTLYNRLPTTDEADGANLGEGEHTVQTYSNGLTETREGNVLYLKDGDKTLMEFETDIYAHIYSITHDGTIYAAAQNVYGKTDIYNAENGELLFKIPCRIAGMNERCILTKSSLSEPMTFGVYGYDGAEILPAEYSLYEIELTEENGWVVPSYDRTDAEGKLYFGGERNSGIYSIDSNGEDMRKLSDKTYVSLDYADGLLFYDVREDFNLAGFWCMKSDGSGECQLAQREGGLLSSSYTNYTKNSDGVYEYEVIYTGAYADYERDSAGNRYDRVYAKDGWIYYMDYGTVGDNRSSIWRVKADGDGVKKEPVITGYDINGYEIRDGKIYFCDETKGKNESGWQPGDLYCYDNGKITLISDLDVLWFAFCGDKIVMRVGRGVELDEADAYIINTDGSGLEKLESFEEVEDMSDKVRIDSKNDIHIAPMKDISDDKYVIYNYYKQGKDKTQIYTLDGGKEKLYAEYEGVTKLRTGDTLYFLEKDGESDKDRNKLVAYDIETGKTNTVADGVMTVDDSLDTRGGDWFTYTDYSFNVWRYNGAEKKLSEVLPNKGVIKYGKLQSVVFKDGSMYKVDKDGNYLFLADNASASCLFVRNGEGVGTHFSGVIYAN